MMLLYDLILFLLPTYNKQPAAAFADSWWVLVQHTT